MDLYDGKKGFETDQLSIIFDESVSTTITKNGSQKLRISYGQLLYLCFIVTKMHEQSIQAVGTKRANKKHLFKLAPERKFEER